MATRAFLSLLLLAVLASTPASATTYMVEPDGTGDFPTIQAAIDAVQSGDVIELSDGTFTGDGNRDIDYLGKLITVRSQNGDADACILDCQGTGVEPHRGFIFQSGESPMSVLEGVTITNGFAGGESSSGGGIYCTGASPTISNCVLRFNRALLGSSPPSGGGIQCEEASPRISDCVLDYNWAEGGGGGVSCESQSAPIISDCLFSSNNAVIHGGGGLQSTNSAPSLIRCTFVENNAPRGAGVRLRGPSSGDPTLTDCQFRNHSAEEGGAISCQETGLTATGCAFSGNSSPRGGAIYFTESSGTFTGCAFSGNTSALGGAVMMLSFSTPSFHSCTFAENVSTGLGGALVCYDSTPTAVQCTFVSNAAVTEGGGAYLWNSFLGLENCIVAFSGEGKAVWCGEGGDATLECCDLFGNAGGDWVGCIADQFGVNGNFSEDPRFCGGQNPEEPYTLREDSPCAPDNNPDCGLIGAWPVGCGPTSSVPDNEPQIISTTWGSIKARTR